MSDDLEAALERGRVDAHLRARLAAAQARLAAVEKLVDEWERGPGPNPRWLNALRVALDPDNTKGGVR